MSSKSVGIFKSLTYPIDSNSTAYPSLLSKVSTITLELVIALSESVVVLASAKSEV